MAISIPSSVFDTYNEAVLLFTRTGTLVYPEKREACPNCYMDTMGTRNRSVSSYKAVETTEDITLRIYWNKKYWVDIGIPLDIPDGSIQTIGYMTDLPKINKAKYLIPKYDGIEAYDDMKYERMGMSYPQGFKQNTTKYIVTFWSRTDA